MTVKLTPHGDYLALVLDRKLLAEHGVDEHTLVDVSFAGSTMFVSAQADPSRKKQFRDALDSTNAEFGHTLKRLTDEA